MKVIEEVKPNIKKYKNSIKKRCMACGSLLEIDFKDTVKYSMYGLPYRKFNCPVCKHFNIVAEKTFVLKED